MAAAAAEEARPAVGAFLLVEHMRLAKVRRQFFVRHSVVDAAELVALSADELMTRVEVAVFRDGEVFVTRAAA